MTAKPLCGTGLPLKLDHTTFADPWVGEEVILPDARHGDLQQERWADAGERVALAGRHYQDLPLAQNLLLLVDDHANSALKHEKGLVFVIVPVVRTHLPIGHEEELAAVAVSFLVGDPELDLADLIESPQSEIQHQWLHRGHRQAPAGNGRSTARQRLSPGRAMHLEGEILLNHKCLHGISIAPNKPMAYHRSALRGDCHQHSTLPTGEQHLAKLDCNHFAEKCEPGAPFFRSVKCQR